MFDRFGSLAERVATNVSRRAFLGRLGQGALGLAAVIGGVLAFPAQALANHSCCMFVTITGGCECRNSQGGRCPQGFVLVDCTSCTGCK